MGVCMSSLRRLSCFAAVLWACYLACFDCFFWVLAFAMASAHAEEVPALEDRQPQLGERVMVMRQP